jgi:hypothetical protein
VETNVQKMLHFPKIASKKLKNEIVFRFYLLQMLVPMTGNELVAFM